MIKNERNFVLNIQDVPKNYLEEKSSHDSLIYNQWEPIRIVCITPEVTENEKISFSVLKRKIVFSIITTTIKNDRFKFSKTTKIKNDHFEIFQSDNFSK